MGEYDLVAALNQTSACSGRYEFGEEVRWASTTWLDRLRPGWIGFEPDQRYSGRYEFGEEVRWASTTWLDRL